MSAPKILIVDIETKPILAYTWGLYDQNLSEDMVVEDWCLLSFSAKWYGEKQVYQADKRNEKDDKNLVTALWKLMDEADIVLGQNSRSFDVKKINARFYHYGLKPPSSYRQLDTKVIAKSKFAFTSNGLAFLSKMNKKYTKSKHTNFPGISLWTECLKGNKKAWDEMAKYNKLDVLATEELYSKLAPWDSSINFGAYQAGEGLMCKCGSKSFVKNGHSYLSTGKYVRYKCIKCGSELRESKAISKAKYRLVK